MKYYIIYILTQTVQRIIISYFCFVSKLHEMIIQAYIRTNIYKHTIYTYIVFLRMIPKIKFNFQGEINSRNESLPRQLFSNITNKNRVLPKMVFLCCTPGIGYIPILECDETKFVIEDPVKPNKLHQFTNVLQASVWLDK